MCFDMRSTLAIGFVLAVVTAFAQVEDIKRESEENNQRTKRSVAADYHENDRTGGFFLFDLFFQAIPAWQRFKLSADRTRYPSLVSLELLAQGAAHPPAYYFLWPRIRGNWGIVSTDYRVNYLIEEVSDGSYIHIRTSDWQILQLNIITSRYLTLRLGNGTLQENFGRRAVFYEWSAMIGVHNRRQTEMLWMEYRHAHDFRTGAWPRLELSAQYQHLLFESKPAHGFISAGVVYQNYYRSVPVVGVQGGLVFRFY